MSCLLIVKVAEALFNSFRNTFVALFVVAVKLVAVVASGSAIDMDMPRPWPCMASASACMSLCMSLCDLCSAKVQNESGENGSKKK